MNPALHIAACSLGKSDKNDGALGLLGLHRDLGKHESAVAAIKTE
jgi:hypothetical protein